ncbi:MAG: Hsp33 family molecular chaperone HslO, partial [Spirochaetia bacterium]|nr:Hsp33 family molecular chaperone HslO [Spirochaetia bacterium]
MEMKEKYRLRDRTLRVMTEDGAFRVSVLKATDMVNHARTRHQTNPAGSVILGEMLMGVLLAASNLKAEERISIRLEVNGEIKSALVEANMAGEVRGYLGNPNPIPQGNTPEENIKNAIGIGLMHVTRTLYNQARPVHSTVMLEHSNIAKDLTHYFAVSEQIPASIRLDIRFNPDFSIRHAMGFMVQAMPGADEEAIIEIENNIIDLPHPSEIIDN